MSLTGQASLSIKKTDLTSDRTSGTYRKVQFAHKASGSETGINLASLTLPSAEMPGFVQPSQAELSACQILFNQKNLVLTSSLRGVLVPFMSYVVASSTQINFTDSFGTALPGEIFVGTIDGTNRDGVNAAATSQIVVTGALPANTTDFNVGTPFLTNANPNQQLGAVLVYLDGQLMLRNTGNATASVSADGNYQEVVSGGSYSSVIRFNQVDPSNERVVMVVSNGSLVEQPSGSMKATIETLAGQQDLVIQTLANVAGVPTSNFYAAPNSVDLLSAGNALVDLKNYAAKTNQSNAWSVGQKMLGLTGADATAVNASGSGYVGERQQSSVSVATNWPVGTGVWFDGASVNLTPGVWCISVLAQCNLNTATMTYWGAGISTSSGNAYADSSTDNSVDAAPPTGVYNQSAVIPNLIVNVTSTTPYYAKFRAGFSAGTPRYYVRLTAIRIA